MSLIDQIKEKDWKPFPRGFREEVEVIETVLHAMAGTNRAFCLMVK
jgi:hypothetical protein